MPDIGLSEMLVIGVVALIVVGPKDLPVMFRRVGEFTGRMRRMARDFQRAMDEAADESGVGDIAGDLRKIANPKKFGTDAFKDAAKDLTAWEPDETTGPATRELSEKRRAQKAAMDAKSREYAEKRLAKEAAAASAPADGPVPDPHAPEPEVAPGTGSGTGRGVAPEAPAAKEA